MKATHLLDEFTTFVTDVEPRLRRALTAGFGPGLGREATADALAYAFEHWSKVAAMRNAAGYLYAVGRSSALRQLARRSREQPLNDLVTGLAAAEDQMADVDLARALAGLTLRQRTTVLLVHGYGWSQAEASALLGISESSLRNHLRRGLLSLHQELEVSADV